MSNKITKIEPDYIKESIVEVKYSSSVPDNLIPGLLYNGLSSHFKFSTFKDKVPKSVTQLGLIDFRVNTEEYFYDDLITIKLRPNSFIFNCIGVYPLWDAYFSRIQQALIIMFESGVISSFTRVGLRYINEYPDIPLKNIVTFKYNFNMPEVTSDSLSFKSEFDFRTHRVILNLISNAEIKNQVSKELIKTSYVDVDVIKENVQVDDLSEFFSIINTAHSIEKDIFFNHILSEDFKQTLKIN